MASAQYSVDIAASMPEGAKTAAQLDDVAQKLIDAGLGAEHMSDAVALASNALGVAQGKAREAAGALAEGNKEFALLERAALQAAKAEEKAAKLGVVPPEVAASVVAASQALGDHTVKLHGLEQAAAKAAAEEKRLAGVLNNTKQASAAGISALKDKAAAEAKAAQAADATEKKATAGAKSLVPLADKWEKLGDAMGSSKGQAILAVGAVTAVAAAIAAVTIALVAGTVALTAWAIGLADTNREAALTSEAMLAIHPELKALAGTIAAVSAETGAHNDELQEWAGNLREAKVAAADIPAALRAMALADAALGNGGAQDLLGEIKANKGAAKDLAAEYNDRLGPIVAKKMLGLTAQTERLKSNIGALFGGLNIEPVLAGFKTLVDLFDKNTAAGQAMQLLFEKVFQPLIDQAQNAAYVVEAFVLGFLIGMTKLYIALKPAIKAVSEFFGFKDTSLSDVLGIATKAGEYAAYVFAGFVAALAAVGAVLVLVWVQTVVMYGAIAKLVVGVITAGAAIVDGFLGAWRAVSDFLGSIDLAETGKNILQGLIDGIINMGPNMLKAITGVVGSAVDAAKHALGIASPSKVFAEIGGYTGEGFAMGVDESAPEAQASMSAMVEPPAPATTSDAAPSTVTTDNSRGAITININGASGNVAQQVIEALEAWAGQSGGAPVPA